MNDDQNGLSLEDEKISKINDNLRKEGERELKGALANVGVEVMPNLDDNDDTNASDTDAKIAASPEINAPTKTQLEEVRKSPEENQRNNVIPSLQTYERDVADTIRAGETVTSINLAEQKRRLEQKHGASDEPKITEKIAKGSLLLTVSAILIVAAIIALGAAFFIKNRNAPSAPTDSDIIISTDSSKEIMLSVASAETIAAETQKILQENSGSGVLVEIVLKKENLGGALAADEMTAEEFFRIVGKNAPSALARSFGKNWLFGFYSRPRVDPFINEPVAIMTLESFDNAYGAMLEWEKKMPEDVGQIFKAASPGNGTPNANLPAEIKFEDLIIRNRDARVLRNAKGEILLLYSFIDSKHLVIAAGEQSFGEVVGRYLSRGLVR